MGVNVGVAGGTGVNVLIAVGEAVGVPVGVDVNVAVGVDVNVAVGVLVAVGVAVGSGVGGIALGAKFPLRKVDTTPRPKFQVRTAVPAGPKYSIALLRPCGFPVSGSVSTIIFAIS